VYLYQLHILSKIKLPNQLSRQGQGRDESWQRQGLSTPRRRKDDDDTNPKMAAIPGEIPQNYKLTTYQLLSQVITNSVAGSLFRRRYMTPTQTSALLFREIPQKCHQIVWFDSTKIGNLRTPAKGKSLKTTVNV